MDGPIFITYFISFDWFSNSIENLYTQEELISNNNNNNRKRNVLNTNVGERLRREGEMKVR